MAGSRQVVWVRSRARADLALVLRVAEFLVGVGVGLGHAGLVVDDHPAAGREAEPLRALAGIGATQRCRDARLEHGRLHRLEQAIGLGAPKACGVDQQDHVGRAGRALALQARQDAGIVGVDPVDAHAGGLAEVRVERLVRLVMAGRVEVQHLFLGRGGQRQCGDAGRERGGGKGARDLHAGSKWRMPAF